MEIENFFRRAVEVQKLHNTSTSLCLNVEGERGVHYFKKTELAVGVMVAGEFSSLNMQLIKRIIPEFKGFALTVVTLHEDVDDLSLKRFLTTLHSLNAGMDFYNVIFHWQNADVRGNLEKISIITQMAFFEANLNLKARTQRALLHNVVFPMVIGQWSRYGEPLNDNLIGDQKMNVIKEDEAIEKMTELFSFKGQWILDISRITTDAVMSTILGLERNCLSIFEEEVLQKTVRQARKVMNMKEGDKEEEEEELEEKEEEGMGKALEEDDEETLDTFDRTEGTGDMQENYIKEPK
ncbi:uncharacterized protein LOC116286299 [Actinia tenebrosa]|uniref:Uncharacterized protein LOC116286299 n=1 Tax=Actinia tenebrosa TaxID=6105 RepID=A0A6P8GWJ9_ACTTE|nr:uncharacterized protein LOC116286299 [Actinia tenebrosa]